MHGCSTVIDRLSACLLVCYFSCLLNPLINWLIYMRQIILSFLDLSYALSLNLAVAVPRLPFVATSTFGDEETVDSLHGCSGLWTSEWPKQKLWEEVMPSSWKTLMASKLEQRLVELHGLLIKGLSIQLKTSFQLNIFLCLYLLYWCSNRILNIILNNKIVV